MVQCYLSKIDFPLSLCEAPVLYYYAHESVIILMLVTNRIISVTQIYSILSLKVMFTSGNPSVFALN